MQKTFTSKFISTFAAKAEETKYEQWVKSLTIDELSKHLGGEISAKLHEFISADKKVNSFVDFINNYSDGSNDLHLIKIYFENIRKEYLESQANKLKNLSEIFNSKLGLNDNKYFIDLTKECLSTRINQSSPLPDSFNELNLDEESIEFSKATRKDAARILGYFTDIKERNSFFKCLVLRGKTQLDFNNILSDRNKIFAIQDLLNNLPVYNYTEIINVAFPGAVDIIKTRKVTPKNISNIIFDIFGKSINLNNETAVNIITKLFDEDSLVYRYIENNLISKNEMFNKKEKFNKFFDELKISLLSFLGEDQEGEINRFINLLKTQSTEKSDSKYPPDEVYNGTDTFSSQSEAEVIRIIRDNFNLACKTSQMHIPLPPNVDAKIATHYFKIDFIIHCPRLVFRDNIPVIYPNTIFVGEYYGLVTKEEENNRAKKQIQMLEEKPSLTDSETNTLNRLRETVKYNEKTPIKQAIESRFANIFGCGSFDIFPSRTHGKWEEQISNGLNKNNVIYNSSYGESNALNQLKEWYSLNKDNITPEVLTSISKFIDTSGKAKPGESFKYNKYTVWIESIKLRFKTLHFEEILETNPKARELWDLTKIQDCYSGRLTVECEEDLLKLRTALKPTEKLINSLRKLNEIEKYLIQNEGSISNYQVKIMLEKFIRNNEDPDLTKLHTASSNKIKGKYIKMTKNTVMDKMTLIKSLVRLAQISESIEESNPAASRLIDDNINDLAKDYGTDDNISDDNSPSESEYKPIETPMVDEKEFSPDHLRSLAKEIAANLISSGKIDEIAQELNSESGYSKLNDIIDNEIHSIFNRS